ncbi:polysaccharide biosynthesis tyrosine autokinase [Methylobacillus flagellatus]|uniref:polysaccharide biosynthesis tyrosine autokinase n=1 Tax=Methylobacillus flagellatus TaxID=405 RepID=UPI002853D549|nr:polysaccharide biosynthesis tyrosine autokinase [Methylobacillus flagellatus]MDR5172647.1 polysaccharide biosynthesis tyrosine autokinase [Methylobacillus flagellatus]
MTNDVSNTNSIPALSADFNIGGMLLKMGKITPQDAERILRVQKERGIRFGEAAESLGLVSAADINYVLSKQFAYPYLMDGRGDFSENLVAAYDPFSVNVEKYRAIRSQLMLYWFAQGKKSLSFSSVYEKDDTSDLVANLGVVFSQLGEKTLIIDAHLDNPRQNRLFNIKSSTGLSDILAGRVTDYASSITRLAEFEHLSILSSGTIPPNPRELLGRGFLKQFIASIANDYDAILVDAPAFIRHSEPLSVASATDGVVLLAKRHISKANDLSKVVDQLAKIRVPVVGTVLTEN